MESMKRTSPPMGLVDITGHENGSQEEGTVMNITDAIVSNVLRNRKETF